MKLLIPAPNRTRMCPIVFGIKQSRSYNKIHCTCCILENLSSSNLDLKSVEFAIFRKGFSSFQSLILTTAVSMCRKFNELSVIAFVVDRMTWGKGERSIRILM